MHGLKFSLNILYREKENHRNLQKVTFSCFPCSKLNITGSLQRHKPRYAFLRFRLGYKLSVVAKFLLMNKISEEICEHF